MSISISHLFVDPEDVAPSKPSLSALVWRAGLHSDPNWDIYAYETGQPGPVLCLVLPKQGAR